MPVIAVINRKGGSGKTTLSTNLAAWLASKNLNVMLGDTDRQQSVRAWETRRPQYLPKIQTWSRNENKVFRAPPNTDHVILDTPGAIYDHELSKILVWVDAVIIPIGPSLFDQDASIRFIDELRQIPRVRSKRCSIAAIGMRWSQEAVQRWREMPNSAHYPLISSIDDDPIYPQASSLGMGVLEYASNGNQEKQLAQWQPVFTWVELQTRLQKVRLTPLADVKHNSPTVSPPPKAKIFSVQPSNNNHERVAVSTAPNVTAVLNDDFSESAKIGTEQPGSVSDDTAPAQKVAKVQTIETVVIHKSWWNRLSVR